MPPQGFLIAEVLEHHGVVVLHGVLVINAVDLGGLDDGVALELHTAQSRRGVRGEVRIARPGGADDHAALFQMPHGAAADIGFADFLHGDGRKHAGGMAGLFQRVLHGKRVQHCGEHTHVVRGGTIHALGGRGQPPENVAAADDQRDLKPHIHHIGYFCTYL